MSATYTTTRDIIITGALRLVGGIGQEESPTATQLTECAEALNIMLKGWNALGDQVTARKYLILNFDAKGQWVFASTPPSLSDIQFNYKSDITALDYTNVTVAKPLGVYNLFMLDNITGTQYELEVLSNHEFQQLGSYTTTAQPSQYTFYNYNTFSVVQCWPKPDTDTIANKKLIMWYKRPIEDLVTGSDIPDFPSEWHEAIKYGLAIRIAPEYKLNPNDRMALKQDFKFIYDEALSANNETASLFFQPNRRR